MSHATVTRTERTDAGSIRLSITPGEGNGSVIWELDPKFSAVLSGLPTEVLEPMLGDMGHIVGSSALLLKLSLIAGSDGAEVIDRFQRQLGALMEEAIALAVAQGPPGTDPGPVSPYVV